MKNPKGSTFQQTGQLVAGLFVGAMLSRGAMGILPENTGLSEAEIKKQNMIKLGARALVAGGSFYGGTMNEENSGSPFISGLAFGASTIQVLDGVTDIAGKIPAVQSKIASGSKIGKIMGKSLGLKCPCDNLQVMPLQRPRKRRTLNAAFPIAQNLPFTPETKAFEL